MNEKEKLNFFNVYIQKATETDSMKKNNSGSRRVFLEGKKSQVKFYFYNEDQINQGKVFLNHYGATN